jgi:hypothetical protein
MVAWTTPRTWTNNETVTDTILNAHVRDNLNAIVSPPYVHVRSASTPSTLGTSASAIQWDTEVADTDNMYAPGSPTRVTVNTAGLYLVQGGYGVASGTINASYWAAWTVNGGLITQAGSTVMVGGTVHNVLISTSAFVRLYANDYVALNGWHQGATSVTTSVVNYLTSWMQLRWMGP